MALDTAMYIQSEGGERILVPVRPDDPGQVNVVPELNPVPEPDIIEDCQQPADFEMNLDDSQTRPPRNRHFYMKEFVARVGPILQALQAREALPGSTTCAECTELVGHWRCVDCTGGKLLCRCCMRHSHFVNPFHRIQCWTGTHFRKAALWEVGVYLTLSHQNGGICANLDWQRRVLERFQKNKDKDATPRAEELSGMHHSDDATFNPDSVPDPVPDPEHDARCDEATMRLLDQMLARNNSEEIIEEDDTDLGDTELDVQDMDAGTAGFTNYMNDLRSDPDQPLLDSIPNAPHCDALNNQYIRAVHTNGIHHIALVFCTCQGHDNITTDLIYAGWVPTSFVRIRTIFTAAVLDYFRYCNLEMTSSAYQFFQLLRRMTNAISPSKVVNLYHELRRLSRLWRWIKKLRWGGYAQQVRQSLAPEPGELGNFCPACPQISINLPENWKDDPNRSLFRRVFTADGNFVAYHIRSSSSPEDDIWLSDGLGMTTRNSDYNAFLQTARERKTVSVNKSHFI